MPDEKVYADPELMSVRDTLNPMFSARQTTARFSATQNENNDFHAAVEMIDYANPSEFASSGIIVNAIATPVSPNGVHNNNRNSRLAGFGRAADELKQCPNPSCNDTTNRVSNPFCWSCKFAFFKTCPNPDCAFAMIPHDKKFCGKCSTELEAVI